MSDESGEKEFWFATYLVDDYTSDVDSTHFPSKYVETRQHATRFRVTPQEPTLEFVPRKVNHSR